MNLELHLISPPRTREMLHLLAGIVRIPDKAGDDRAASTLDPLGDGASVRIRSLATGLTEEAFLDARGAFFQEVELQPEADNVLELTVCDGAGREVARLETSVRHRSATQPMDQDEPKAVQRPAEPREVTPQPGASRGQALDPPWPRFARLVRHCLDAAAEVARSSGRDPQELFEYVHAQERYAEQAHAGYNQALYRECRENLEKYAGYLDGLLRGSLPRPAAKPTLPPEEEARAEVERFRNYLSHVWKQVRANRRADLEPRLAEIARQAGGLTQRIKEEPVAVAREARRLGTEVSKVEEQFRGGRPRPAGGAGLLEGTG
jgi:hypothetical protein